jgi:hypothetical protein
MKKTIIAAAVSAVVAMPAMADVTVSGYIGYETGEANNIAVSNVYSDIYVKASEDLGNGMKVAAMVQLVNDNNEDTNEDEGMKTLTISGDFGTIQTGYFETYTEDSVAAMAANDASHGISNEILDGNSGLGTGHRYTSPSFGGVTVGAESFQTGETTVFGQYSGNGLTVRVAEEHTGATGDVLSMAAKYTIDGLTVAVVNTDDDVSDDQTWFGVSYTMGANTIAYSVVDGNDDSSTAAAADDGDSTLSLSHALSKNTTVYVAVEKDDDADTNDQTLIGLSTKF